MKTELSSHIRLDQVSKRYYQPESELDMASLTRFEKVTTRVVENSDDGSAMAAAQVVQCINKCVEQKGQCVIGFGAGKCALKVYDELVKLYFADKVSFANVIAFNISELGIGVVEADEQSTFVRLKRHLFNKVDIDPANIHTFSQDATQENVHQLCKAYESEISEYGGLDLVVCELTKVASLAFNEPGSPSNSTCRLMLLSDDSRMRVAESFQRESAPRTAVTLGISNLMAARNIIAVAWGEDSAPALHATVEGRMTDLVPASFLQMHHSARIIADLEAAIRLTRINYPWRVTSCQWTDYLIRRAIVWLCHQTGKPILKLTNKDYNDNGLSELVVIYGSAYDVNIKIFNVLQHTITGWPGGKPNADDTHRPERAAPYPKRVLVFSPHPDDAVVSMGGTLRRLVQQGHDVHVAFETNGDVAVADEDLLRTMMLSEKVSAHYNMSGMAQQDLAGRIRQEVLDKAPGEADSDDVRYVKGQIFACEGIMSCTYLGVKPEQIYELNLPFFTSEAFGHGRVTDQDVAIARELIERIKPHQIFVSDGLNDTYGTQVRAADAVLMAIEQLKHEPWTDSCWVWLYRGQWGQWDVDQVEMAVPMSPEEFRVKRDAILKHQSQIHDAPIRENDDDDKLSWERSIERNRDMADLYSRLGLASYEAIEAFVQYHPLKD